HSIATTRERVLEIVADLKTRIANGDFRNA
ncbi:dephospho-CoA kinase, partial [Rhizobium ruizarguesonis]